MAGMTKKILKTLGKEFTTANNIANGGGLSSIAVPRKLSTTGGFALMGAATLGIGGYEAVKGNSKARTGVISYGEGMSRMTNTFNTGVTEAMQRVSDGDYEVYSDMAKGVLDSGSLSGLIDDFGANPGMIAALYNMGGN